MDSPSRRRVLREQVEGIVELAERTIKSPQDWTRFENRLAQVREALGSTATEPISMKNKITSNNFSSPSFWSWNDSPSVDDNDFSSTPPQPIGIKTDENTAAKPRQTFLSWLKSRVPAFDWLAQYERKHLPHKWLLQAPTPTGFQSGCATYLKDLFQYPSRRICPS